MKKENAPHGFLQDWENYERLKRQTKRSRNAVLILGCSAIFMLLSALAGLIVYIAYYA